MKSKSFLSSRRPICQLCEHITRQPGRQRPIYTASTTFTQQTRPMKRFQQLNVPHKSQLGGLSSIKSKSPPNTAKDRSESVRRIHSAADEEAAIQRAQELGNIILTSESVPTEETTLEALQACENAAKILSESLGASNGSPKQPASALLNIPSASYTSRGVRKDLISSLAYKLLLHPTVFISPKVLKSYVTTQSLLRRPETFPEIFDLYAIKPVPEPNTTPVKYKTPNPSAAPAAVDKDVADAALTSALQIKDLDLALSIIETTYTTPAFHRSKILREAGAPIFGAICAPFAIYALSSQLSQFQSTMDPAMATRIMFAGTAAYVAAVGTIGFVAITTRNDQMDRVTWAPGLPLRERWIREPERAAVDRVAQAWGFKNMDRRGEEEGEEWELLKEWAGNRGMIVDRVELMEGME